MMLENDEDNDCPYCRKDNKFHRDRFKDFDKFIKEVKK